MKPDKQLPASPTWMIISPMAPFVRGPKPFTREPEKIDSSSKTIPDDSFTIAELFGRLSKGQPLPNGLERPISYSDLPTHDSIDLAKISRMDLTEVHDLKKRVSDTLYHLNERKAELDAQKAQNDDKTTKKADNPSPSAT